MKNSTVEHHDSITIKYQYYTLLMYPRPNLDLLFAAQNGVVLEPCRTEATQNRHSSQFTDKWAERGYYDESDIVLCMK